MSKSKLIKSVVSKIKSKIAKSAAKSDKMYYSLMSPAKTTATRRKYRMKYGLESNKLFRIAQASDRSKRIKKRINGLKNLKKTKLQKASPKIIGAGIGTYAGIKYNRSKKKKP